ncbi:MAG: ATP synthase F0 subunit B, partial [Acidobacteria bacterium]|nr:ATP synthase F0 subunit B [Acidobacteriota bacterium]
ADRTASIFAARDLAVRQSDEATRVLSGSEQRLSKIDEEVATLVEEAHRDAEREKGRASEDGKRQAERIIEVTEREVNNERVGANRALRTFVADLAVNMAATNLADQLTPDDHNELIRDYLSRLGKSMA